MTVTQVASERYSHLGRPPRLLLLSQRVPYPPHDGAALRTYNILRLLSEDFEIHGLCFDRRDSSLAGISRAERLERLAPLGTFEAYSIPQDENRIRFGLDHLRSVLTGRPYTWYIHESVEFRQRLHQLLESRSFDIVHLDSLDLVSLLPDLVGKNVVLTHHNVESTLLRRRASREAFQPVSWYLRYQSNLLRRSERYWLARVGMNIVVSPEDAAEFRQIAPNGRIAIVPNGVDTEYFFPCIKPTDGCVFVGGTSWYPNLDGLEWFVAEILPRLRRLGMESIVTWVGRATPGEMAHYNQIPGLRLTGYVPDIRPFVQDAACFIVPLQVGGGTRLKLLDAWAMGKAVVSTRQGAEGLNTVNEENILLADSADEFAGAVMRVLGDDALRARLEIAARRTAMSDYSWEVLSARMRTLYLSLLEAPPSGA